MTVNMQGDHLTAGAWAACGSIKENIAWPITGSMCEINLVWKKWHCFSTLLKRLALGNENFVKVMKAINQGSIQSKFFMLFKRCWACKQKIIQWWSTWPDRNAFLTSAVIHEGQFNSSNFIADFGCSNEKLAEFHKELQET